MLAIGVECGARKGRPWNEFVARYHYLGHKTLVGAHMRYVVHDRNGWPVAMILFSTTAWKLAPRDSFIGWARQLRGKKLPLVVDKPRFPILPWIEVPNLGSHILALVRRRLPGDWTERYSTTPVLIETFVETPRYTGAVYRASGWTYVGTTHRDEGATTATSSTTSPESTSGSGLSKGIGNAPSTARIRRIGRLSTACRNPYERRSGTVLR